MKRNLHILLTSLVVLAAPLVASSAHAQYELKEITPDVQSALENRKERYEQLSALKAQGVLGENNHGYVDVLKDEGAASQVAFEENQDRKVIYTAVAEQNDITSSMDVIEKVFAQVQREKAKPGESIQEEDGQWSVK